MTCWSRCEMFDRVCIKTKKTGMSDVQKVAVSGKQTFFVMMGTFKVRAPSNKLSTKTCPIETQKTVEEIISFFVQKYARCTFHTNDFRILKPI